MKEIIINRQENSKQILLIEDGNLTEKYNEDDNVNRIEGNIYIGKVENVLQGMQSAFVNIGQERNTFIHLKDIVPKVDVKNGEPEENIKIKDVVKCGEPILIQVKRDFTEAKGAKVSTHISLNSRYIVFMPNTTIVTISQKIEDEKEKTRLTNIAHKYLPENCGAIIRTSAQNQSEDIIKKDIEIAVEKWSNINRLYEENKANNNYPKLLYKSHNVIKKLLIDLLDKDLERITVNCLEDYEYINKTLKEFNANIEVIQEEKNFMENRPTIKHQIELGEKRKIWLKCGGFITIDKTEALTAIDVNSGKYTGTDNVESTIYKVNKEASIEIAKQLKLRDIGGIIIIDYINMQIEENNEKIIEVLKDELKKDRTKTQIVGFSKLNLLELTRKHICGN